MLHDPQFRVRFEREIKTFAALKHPAIVPVYDVGEKDGQPYFVMRYMPGGSLQDRIAQGPISLQETARIFSKLAAWSMAVVGFTGKSEDVIRLIDISTCDPYRLSKLDEFPGTRFTPEGFLADGNISDFDWDGESLFVINTSHRNNGWGFMYIYNRDINQGVQKNPAVAKSRCCYRDARWSPDRNYLAFQSKDVINSPVQLYYLPANALNAGIAFEPIPIPNNLFGPKDAPQFALHPAE